MEPMTELEQVTCSRCDEARPRVLIVDSTPRYPSLCLKCAERVFVDDADRQAKYAEVRAKWGWLTIPDAIWGCPTISKEEVDVLIELIERTLVTQPESHLKRPYLTRTLAQLKRAREKPHLDEYRGWDLTTFG